MTPLRRLLTATAATAALSLVAACGSSEPDAAETPGDVSNGSPEAESSPTEPDAGAETGTDSDEITMADVEANATADSCWAVIDDSVYDLTDWIDDHPGGSGAIQGLCGTDATAQFEAQHGGSSGPENQLAEFEIGELAD